MSSELKLIITGDTYPGGGMVKALAEAGDVESLFGDYLPLFRDADLAVTNLESPLIDEGDPIQKTGPVLKSPVSTVNVFKKAGFGLMTLANNHIMDYGEDGLRSTVKVCTDAGLSVTGAGESLEEAKQPYLFDKGGVSVVLVNIAENEFGTTRGEWPGCHPLDPVMNFNVIQQAVGLADHVVVIVHGGHEHYELPSPRMKQTYQFFIDAGASAVIGHHPHCICGYEIYRDSPVCYSLGNFLFDLPGKGGTDGAPTPWNEGLIAELTVTKERVSAAYHPFLQSTGRPGLKKPGPEEEKALNEKIIRLNNVLLDDRKLKEAFDAYCSRTEKLYSSYIEPHSSRILHALRNRNLAPSLLSTRKKRLLLNLTRCEAHRDVLVHMLESQMRQ